MENSTEIIETTCVIPINTYAAIVWYVDLGKPLKENVGAFIFCPTWMKFVVGASIGQKRKQLGMNLQWLRPTYHTAQSTSTNSKKTLVVIFIRLQ